MKKFKILIIAAGVLFIAATVNFERIYDGIKVGRTYPKNILANELKTLVGIDTTKTIKEQFDSKPDTANVITPADLAAQSDDLYNYVFSKDSVNSLLSLNSNKLLNDLKAMGFNGIATPVGWINTATSTETMVDGDIRGVTIVVPKAITMTGYRFVLSTAGVYTGDNVNGICLYSRSGTTLTKVAGSEITDANMWTVSDQNVKPLGTPITLAAGEYKIAYMYNNSAQTTAPVLLNLGTHANSSATKYLFSSTNWISFKYASQTALPASVSTGTLSISTHIPAIWIY